MWNGRARREEGLERWRERNGRMIEGMGGEGREIQKEVKGLERAGDPLYTERYTQRGGAGRGWGHDVSRSGVQVGPKLGQAGQRRDASCP